MLEDPRSSSVAGLVGATATVIITTLEDCVWLVPFVSQAPSVTVGLIHALVFCATFEGLALAICFGSIVIGASLENLWGLGTSVLGIIGAALCWGLALFLYCRARLKRRRRQEAAEQAIEQATGGEYGSLVENATPETDDTTNHDIEHDVNDEGAWTDLPTVTEEPQPWMIVTLTILGSLDEVSYFPALIFGNIFTPTELCLGTLLASLIILIMLYMFLSQCQPLLNLLGRIPLHNIVAIFAVLLTLEVLWEVLAAK